MKSIFNEINLSYNEMVFKVKAYSGGLTSLEQNHQTFNNRRKNRFPPTV